MLTRVVGECWHALVLDVLRLGFREEDMFTTLSLRDMVSIAVAAPPNSSVRYYLDGGWSRTDHLLANMAEQRAGVAKLEQPYPRPGLAQRAPAKSGFFAADAIDWVEADRRDAIRNSGQFKHGPSRGRALSAVRGVG